MGGQKRCTESVLQLMGNLPTRDRAVYYGAAAVDVGEVLTSTSGGVASALSRTVLRSGGVVFGASFNPFPKVCHVCVSTEEELQRLKGSKYVESDIRGCLSKIKEYLLVGRSVLFVGLPCQVAAVYSYVGGDKDNLYTVDLICHGKPPQRLFNRWIKSLEHSVGAPIVDYKFRNKNGCAWNSEQTHQHYYCLSDGSWHPIPVKKNWYGRYFLGSSSFMDGCYKCPFARIPRIGDVTLGDFWGGEEDPRLEDFATHGLSLVSVQSVKGMLLIKMSMDLVRYIEVKEEFAVGANRQLTHPSKRPIYRNFLFRFVYAPEPIRWVCDWLLFYSGKMLKRFLCK